MENRTGCPDVRLPETRSSLQRWFQDEIIILCIRWYLRYNLSYRNLVETIGERGLSIAPSTILRWVVRYAEELERRWRRFERPLGRLWRCDETYIKGTRKWVYLYGAVDENGTPSSSISPGLESPQRFSITFRMTAEHVEPVYLRHRLA